MLLFLQRLIATLRTEGNAKFHLEVRESAHVIFFFTSVHKCLEFSVRSLGGEPPR